MFSLIEHLLTFKPNATNHGALEIITHKRLRFGGEVGMDLDAAWFPNESKAAVLFLHGNRHNITRFYDHYAMFQRLGLSCFTFDYPGYGTSKGRPSESALYTSAQAALSHVRHKLGFAEKEIAIYGCSLGGAVAVELARTSKIGCLITESTFTNSHDIAAFLYPYLPITRFLERRFSNDDRIGQITVPKLLIHGARDPRVPLHMAHTLHQRATGLKELVIVPEADHVNCITTGGQPLWDRIGLFITKHCQS